MTPQLEKRLLQIVVGIACLVPIAAGGVGIALGPEWLGAPYPAAVDLDSHFRYLSGILLAIGFAFAGCIPDIEEKGLPFRMLGLLVVAGGLARLISMIASGLPSGPHLFGLGMELIVVPLLITWQARVDARFAAISPRRGEAPHPLLGRKRAG
jgi:hypothetical protein